jgi:hypothetical protein
LLGEEGEAVHVVEEAQLRQKKLRIGQNLKDEKPERKVAKLGQTPGTLLRTAMTTSLLDLISPQCSA